MHYSGDIPRLVIKPFNIYIHTILLCVYIYIYIYIYIKQSSHCITIETFTTYEATHMSHVIKLQYVLLIFISREH